jgi:hypothetical protein
MNHNFSVSVPYTLPDEIKEYYSKIIKSSQPTFNISSKPTLCITTSFKDTRIQAINIDSLVNTVNNYVIMPLESNNTIQVLDSNNNIITSIYRGINDNINQLSQDNGPWISMNSSIMINGYQFKLLGIGSPPLWDSVGRVPISSTTISSFYRYLEPQYYYGNTYASLLAFGLIFIIILLLIMYYRYYKNKKHNSKLSELSDSSE